MERMEQKILSEGKVLPGGILKVGSIPGGDRPGGRGPVRRLRRDQDSDH